MRPPPQPPPLWHTHASGWGGGGGPEARACARPSRPVFRASGFRLYLIDFGLTRRYVNSKSEHISFAVGKGLIGTPWFCRSVLVCIRGVVHTTLDPRDAGQAAHPHLSVSPHHSVSCCATHLVAFQQELGRTLPPQGRPVLLCTVFGWKGAYLYAQKCCTWPGENLTLCRAFACARARVCVCACVRACVLDCARVIACARPRVCFVLCLFCCAVLCCRCGVLCWAGLGWGVLGWAGLGCVVLCCAALRCGVVWCGVVCLYLLFCFLFSFFFVFVLLCFCFVLFCFVCLVLFCFVLFCFVLFCFVLFCLFVTWLVGLLRVPPLRLKPF